MSTPDFGDVITRVGDFLRYPRRVMLEILRSAFSSDYLFTNTAGHQLENPYLYKADAHGNTEKDSQIEFADAWTQELDATDPRPIVLIQRGPLGFHDSTIDGFKHSDARGLEIEYADCLRIPLTFLCFSQEDLESEEIALTTALVLRFFRKKILKKTLLHKVDTPLIGERAVISRGSRSDLYSTPVSFSVHMPINWVVKATDPREVKGFAVSSSFSSLK